ncbi:MAG: hypothetical protein AB1758_13415 [Candidatus Eremiobacterota bacterium]
MQIDSPSRETIQAALQARTHQLIAKGDIRAAEEIQRDMVALSRAPGDNLYDMHRRAREVLGGMPPTDAWSREWTYPPSLRAWSEKNLGRTTLGAAAACTGAVLGLFGGPVARVAGILILGGVAAVGVHIKRKIGAQQQALATLDAVERQQDFIRSYQPDPSEAVRIDRQAFLDSLQAREAGLAESGKFVEAGDLHQVHQALAELPGDTVEELFRNLISSGNRDILNLMQGSCSGAIAQTIEDLAALERLMAPGPGGTVGEKDDSMVIGGVVLKKSQAAA